MLIIYFCICASAFIRFAFNFSLDPNEVVNVRDRARTRVPKKKKKNNSGKKNHTNRHKTIIFRFSPPHLIQLNAWPYYFYFPPLYFFYYLIYYYLADLELKHVPLFIKNHDKYVFFAQQVCLVLADAAHSRQRNWNLINLGSGLNKN